MIEARGYVTPRIDLLHVLMDGKIAECFNRSGAREYIGRITVRTEAGLDIYATSKNAGVDLVYDPTMSGAGRYTPRKLSVPGSVGRIQLRPGRPDEQRIFGHEVGHHFLDEELNIGDHLLTEDRGIYEPVSEAFCEFFGGRMLSFDNPDDHSLEVEAKETNGIPNDYQGYIMGKLLEL